MSAAFGWATARSVDRPRPWAREGTPSDRSGDRAIVHATAVAGLAGVFAYQGLVPKLWKLDRGEVAIWRNLGLPERLAEVAVRASGTVEAGFAAITIARSGKRWPFAIAIAAMPALAIGAGRGDRTTLTNAFNPVSLGIAVAALGAIAIATTDG